jgi:hypothetical protein
VDEYQMTRWPRYELFKEITAVYRRDGRTAPLFNDKVAAPRRRRRPVTLSRPSRIAYDCADACCCVRVSPPHQHLSWSWEHALDMVAESEELGFPMSGGSGLSVTWRMPSLDLPHGAVVEESLVIGPGWADGGDLYLTPLCTDPL